MSTIEEKINEKVLKTGKPLKDWKITIYRGILTGCNEAFIINGDTRAKILEEDLQSDELIRPILRGRDISRYSYVFADLWLINTHNGLKEKSLSPINVDDYPAIKSHLMQFYDKLKKRADKGVTPYNLRNCAYLDDFNKPKMVWKRIGSLLRFCLDESGAVCLDSTCIAVGDHIPYLVGVLNSTVGNYLFRDSPKTGTGDLIVSVQAIEPIRVPIPSLSVELKIEEIVRSIIKLSLAGLDYTALENQMEDIIYELYGFTEDERKYIESFTKKNFR